MHGKGCCICISIRMSLQALEEHGVLQIALERSKAANRETVCRIHKKELGLKEDRQKFLTYTAGVEDSIHDVLAQESWVLDKHGKFRSQRQISNLRANFRISKVYHTTQ